MGRPNRYSPEVKERAVRMVFEHAAEHAWLATCDDPDLLAVRLTVAGIELPELRCSVYDHAAPDAALLLDVRMLFSTLVDADFLETEAHFDRDDRGERRYRPPPPELQAERALEIVATEVEHLSRRNRTRSSPAVQALRADLYGAALDAAELPPGRPYTLSAPTGSGKTLSMLAFALRHGETRRIRSSTLSGRGRSPQARGNLEQPWRRDCRPGPIPAGAGKPTPE